jgi:hypothetical protein
VGSDDTVANVKKAYEKRQAFTYTPGWLRFIYAGQQLQDEKTMKEYGIQTQSWVHVTGVMRGD